MKVNASSHHNATEATAPEPTVRRLFYSTRLLIYPLPVQGANNQEKQVRSGGTEEARAARVYSGAPVKITVFIPLPSTLLISLDYHCMSFDLFVNYVSYASLSSIIERI